MRRLSEVAQADSDTWDLSTDSALVQLTFGGSATKAGLRWKRGSPITVANVAKGSEAGKLYPHGPSTVDLDEGGAHKLTLCGIEGNGHGLAWLISPDADEPVARANRVTLAATLRDLPWD